MITPFLKLLSKLKMEAQKNKLTFQINIPASLLILKVKN